MIIEGDKLANEKDQNSKLEDVRSKILQLQNKCNKGGIPINHPPSYNLNVETLSQLIHESFRVLACGEEYGTNKKICYFGGKTHVLKMNVETEAWETVDIKGPHEFGYYAAATSTHDGNAMIVGGGNSQDAFLYIEAESMYIHTT